MYKKLKNAFYEYAKFLGWLPKFDLSEDKMNYVEDISSDFNIGTLNDIVESKNYEIKNSDIWIEYN